METKWYSDFWQLFANPFKAVLIKLYNRGHCKKDSGALYSCGLSHILYWLWDYVKIMVIGALYSSLHGLLVSAGPL